MPQMKDDETKITIMRAELAKMEKEHQQITSEINHYEKLKDQTRKETYQKKTELILSHLFQ